MEAKHTKQFIVDYHTTSTFPYKYVVSEVQETPEEAEANAKLIAAAPELLEALIRARDFGLFQGVSGLKTIKQIENAIKKATE